MRQDVKLGVVFALGLVMIAGGYYLFRDKREIPVPVTDGPLASRTDGKDATGSVTPDARRAAASPDKSPAGGKTITPAQPANRGSNRVAANQPRPGSTTPNTPPRQTTNRQPRPNSPAATRTANSRQTPRSQDLVNDARGPAGDTQDGATPSPVPATRRTAGNSPVNRRPATPPASEQEPASAPADSTPVTTRRSPAAATNQPSSGNSPTPLAGTTPPAPTGTADAIESHKAQPGDTFSTLAEMYYGDAQMAPFLLQHNPHVRAGLLRPGHMVKIPPRPESGSSANLAARPSPTAGTSERPSAGSAAHRTYVVKEGQSFYVIARDVLGDASRWDELFELNKQACKGDPKRLRVGQEILLP